MDFPRFKTGAIQAALVFLDAHHTIDKAPQGPILSAATATTHQTLRSLSLETVVPGAATLLSGRY